MKSHVILLATASFAFFLTLAQMGCAFDRLNHMHSEANAAKVGDAGTNIHALTSSTTGLDARIITNLNAELALLKSNSDVRLRLDEIQGSLGIVDKTWIDMRADFLLSVGLGDDFQISRKNWESRASNTDPANYWREIETADGKMSKRISDRIHSIKTIAQLLDTLSKGQAAKAKEAASRIDSLNKWLTSQTNSPTAPTNLPSQPNGFAELFEQLQSDIIVAAGALRTNAASYSQAIPLENQILAEADASRDPASAYAIVAIIGNGLGSGDFKRLDDFIEALQNLATNRTVAGSNVKTDVSAIESQAEEAHNNATTARSQARQKWNALNASDNDRAREEAMKLESEAKAFEANFADLNRVRRRMAILKTISSPDNAAMATAKLLDADGSEMPVPEIWKPCSDSFFRFYRLTATAPLHDSDGNRANSAKAFNLPTLGLAELNLENARTSLTNLAHALITNAEDIASVANDFGLKSGTLNSLAADTNVLNSVSIILKSLLTDNSAQNAGSLLKMGLSDPQVAKFIDAKLKLSPDETKFLSQLGSDLKSERLAASARLVQFFADLASVQNSMYQETARHYTALSGIASHEIQRWHWINTMHQANLKRFRWQTAAIPVADSTFYPLATSDAFNDYSSFYAQHQDANLSKRGFKDPTSNVGIPPSISPTNQILPSIRLLAEYAQHFQNGSPSELDPFGLYTRLGRERLKNAIELLESCYLMQNFNARQAESLRLILLGEIRTHDIHLDSVGSLVAQADIRLGLGDSTAFHTSGWTESDVQTIIGFVQSGFLAWIGNKR